MKTTKLKKNWIYKIERFFYSYKNEATDTCTFRKRLLTIIVMSPFLLGTMLWSKWLDVDDDRSISTSIWIKLATFIILLAIIGGILNDEGFEISHGTYHILIFWGLFFFSTTIAAMFVGLFAGIAIGIAKTVNFINKMFAKRNNSKKHKRNSIKQLPWFKVMYKSIKEKVCFKIEWIN